MEALKTNTIEERTWVSPAEGKLPALPRFYRVDHTETVFIEEHTASCAGMVAENDDFPVRKGYLYCATLAELGDRNPQILCNLCHFGFADADSPPDQAATAAALAFELAQVFVR